MPSVKSDNGDDVVVTGLSGRLAESDSIEEFARQLFDGVDMVTTDNRRWKPGMYGLPKRSGKLKNLSRFDAMFFGVSAKQAYFMDPQLRMLLETSYEVIVDAGLSPSELRGSRTGVFVAVSYSETEEFWAEDVDKLNGYALMGCYRAMFPNRVSHAFDLKGPSYAVDSACSSSISALTQATNAIKAGLCNAAIVAGTNLCLKPANALSFHRLSMLSPSGRCASFDASADGFTRSEAVVAVLLQRRRDARRIFCTIRSARLNNDGYKVQGISYPSGDMQRRLAMETLEEAGLRPQDILYVEAHGTGTKVGDPEEVNAIAELYCKNRQTPLLLGSVKSNMGHAETASGMCSLAKIVLSMERSIIPGNLHYEKPNSNIPALKDGRIKVVDRNTPWQGGLAALNSTGFGGTNAHVILESHRSVRSRSEYAIPRLVLASGRTDAAVEQLLSLAAENARDSDLHALIDAVHSRAISGHPWRGYTILHPPSAPVTEVLESDDGPRPIWFVFSGMGSQWPGMARNLLRLPTFAASIARSSAVLEPYGVKLQHVIAEAPETAFDDVINCFVSITAVQVALVDVLRELGVHPDGMVGHSLGETACAYADNTLSAEQAVQCAYWRGRCTLDSKPTIGAMAAVGLSWEEAGRRCPKDVELACHNSADNVTISGPLASVKKFVEELSAEGVFTRGVNTSNVAYHSSYIADAAPLVLAALKKVIPEPKQRSALWLSTSVPQDQWSSDHAKLSDAAYHVNNLVAPVHFAPVLSLLPANALVIEVAPHALLHAVLRREMPRARHVPLLRRDAQVRHDALVHFLSAVGKVYASGAQPQVSRLYPAVSYPVSRGTPSIASHVGWDHSIEWGVADFTMPARTGENIVEYDLSKPDDDFIAGHNIDGRILFPFTGYIVLVWRTLAKLNNLEMEEAAVVLENVKIHRATLMSSDVPVRFCIRLSNCTGEFEVCEGGTAVVTGTARLTDDAAKERLSATTLAELDPLEKLPLLSSEDIYTELHLRGYNYNGVFRGLKSSDARGTSGLVNWTGNWVSFMDAVLQIILIGMETRHQYMSTRLQRVVIDPEAHREAIATSNENVVPVKYYRNVNTIVSGGVEFRGITGSVAPRRRNLQAPPKLEKYVFIPFNSGVDTKECSQRHALTTLIQLALENCSVFQFNIAEFALQRPLEDLLLPHVLQVLEVEPAVRVNATLLADAIEQDDSIEALGIKVTNKDTQRVIEACDVVLGINVLSRHSMLGADVLSRRVTLAMMAPSGNFVLLEEPAGIIDEPKMQSLICDFGFILVSRMLAGSHEFLLLRRAVNIPTTRIVLELRDDYAWLDHLKHAMKRAETEDMRVYVWSREATGAQGLAKSLRQEPGGERLRLYYLRGAEEAFDPDASAYKAQVQLDLAFNVLRDGVWGTYRHLPLELAEQVQVKHAYVNTLTRGDLSSLRWIESDLNQTPAQLDPDICRVHYAALNFHDVMVATGELPGCSEKDCIIGSEFSGYSSTGKRMMGIVAAKGLATTVLGDKSFLWEVPQQWSLEEAATVPVAYATAYYALTVRGRLRSGESVLVHAGAGGVGLAAITIAVHAGCTVYTTVSTPYKRAFLRKQFPELPDANIGQSRDCSFEQLVLRRTSGRGVDLVLNSLAGDKLQSSLRCLAKGGRFLEIGKLDLSTDNLPGMTVLLKNTSIQGVYLDELLGDQDHPDRTEVVRCVSVGIAVGAVRPLPTTVFADNQLEEAFRYMATGKHIGKVLIRICEKDSNLKPARLRFAIPQTYMLPGKSYVLVGGLGGFGLELSEWLIGHGARTLVFNTRSSVRTRYQGWCIRRWREKGVRVLVSTSDTSTILGARTLLQEAAEVAPIGGIFNLAAVLRDAFLENLTTEDFRDIEKPKTYATRALDAASRELAPELDHFVVFSSMSCGRGNAGQTNYGLANSAMERLCEERQAAGLPALAVQWGVIDEVGLLMKFRDNGENLELAGLVPQSIASCLTTMGTFMRSPHAVVSSVVLADKQRSQEKPAKDLIHTVANILGITEPSRVSEMATLAELGIDSLMNTEVKQTLERGYDVLLSVQDVRALTFGKLRGMGNLNNYLY